MSHRYCDHCDGFLDSPSRESCNSTDGTGFTCTKPKGHDGPHVACAPSANAHELATWETPGEKPKPAGMIDQDGHPVFTPRQEVALRMLPAMEIGLTMMIAADKTGPPEDWGAAVIKSAFDCADRFLAATGEGETKGDADRFAAFGRAVWGWIKDHPEFCGEEMSEEILPLARDAGLCRRVVYDPEIHGDGIDADPGCEVWYWGEEAAS